VCKLKHQKREFLEGITEWLAFLMLFLGSCP
jgi:hypothetical protein